MRFKQALNCVKYTTITVASLYTVAIIGTLLLMCLTLPEWEYVIPKSALTGLTMLMILV